MISYPYSLRELAHVVRHLERFPDMSLRDAFRNVFDFDVHRQDAEAVLRTALQHQALPVSELFSAHDRDARGQRMNIASTGAVTYRDLIPPAEVVNATELPAHVAVQTSAVPLTWQTRTWSEEFATTPRHRSSIAFESMRTGGQHSVFSPVIGQWRIPAPINTAVTAAATNHVGNALFAVTRGPHRLYHYALTSAGAPARESVAELPALSPHVAIMPATALPGGQVAFVADRANGVLLRVDLAPGGSTHVIAQGATDGAAALHGGYLLLAADGGTVTAVRAAEPKNIHVAPVCSGRHVAAISPTSAVTWGAADGSASLVSFPSAAADAQPIITVFPAGSPLASMLATDEEAAVGAPPPTAAKDVVATVAALGSAALLHADGRLTRVTDCISPEAYAHVANTVIGLDDAEESLTSVDLCSLESRTIPLPAAIPSRPRRASQPATVVQLAGGAAAVVRDQGHVVILECSSSLLEEGAREYVRLAPADVDVDAKRALAAYEESNSGAALIQYIDEDRRGAPDAISPASRSPPPLGDMTHGEVDDKEHIGGSRFAGGSGGSNTAGLGGRGGPYRLAKRGQRVVQVSDEKKAEVSREARQLAREMAQAALRERLEALDMSEGDATEYAARRARVDREARQLGNMLDTARAREKERVWHRNRSDGELDESRLVDGLVGDTAVFKLRAEDSNDTGIQAKPKRFVVAFDVSGSMYRFNVVDGRLEKSLEAATLLMEAFAGADPKRFALELVGHSGESERVTLTESDKLPSTDKERLRVLHMMEAHAQYCVSGDSTLDATRNAIAQLARTEFDEAFVIVVSDANLERYGIDARDVQQALAADPRVNAHMIFIGSLGDQAEEMVRALPPGRAFICEHTTDLPNIIQQIFALAMRQH